MISLSDACAGTRAEGGVSTVVAQFQGDPYDAGQCPYCREPVYPMDDKMWLTGNDGEWVGPYHHSCGKLRYQHLVAKGHTVQSQGVFWGVDKPISA